MSKHEGQSFRQRLSTTVSEISVSVSGYLPGRSSNILSWSPVSSDRIIAPGKGWGMCYQSFEVRTPYRDDSDVEKVTYKATISSVTFSH